MNVLEFLKAAVGRESKQVSVSIETKRGGKKSISKQLVIPVPPFSL